MVAPCCITGWFGSMYVVWTLFIALIGVGFWGTYNMILKTGSNRKKKK